MKDKAPVHNTDAERAVIGSILMNENSMIEIADFLTAKDFYHDAHSDIYTILDDMFCEGEPIDLVTLMARLEDVSKLKDIGGATYLAKLMNGEQTPLHILSYGNTVKRDSVSRRIQALARLDEDPVVLIKELRLLEEELEIKIPKDLDQVFQEYAVEYEERKGKDGQTGVNTGFSFVDNNAPLEKDTLTVLAARSSSGKSAWALTAAMNAAMDGNRVMFVSAEMSIYRLMDRLLAMLTGVAAEKFRKSQADESMKAVAKDVELLKDRLIFHYLPRSSSAEICKLVRKEHAKNNIDLVVVDYLQYLNDSKGKNDNEATRVGKMTRNFKALSGQCNNAVIALSQVNRAAAMENDGRPKIHQLRDSGAIEQDADTVLILNRINKDSTVATLDIAKNRNGDADMSTVLLFDHKTTFFSQQSDTGASTKVPDNTSLDF